MFVAASAKSSGPLIAMNCSVQERNDSMCSDGTPMSSPAMVLGSGAA